MDAERGVVVKRFRSSERREPVREWAALTLLAEFAPGLAADPVRADLAGDPPVIEMSRLSGVPLGGSPLSAVQADALAIALERLWNAVPRDRLAELGEAELNASKPLACCYCSITVDEGVSRPVGRILCTRLRGPTVIHLGLPLPAASCGLPASIGRAALNRSRRPVTQTSPLDLAPGGVYQAAAVTCGAGGLLHHRFTLTPRPERREAVCFLWHCPAGHPGSALPTTLPYGVRTFLTSPIRLSATARPTHPGSKHTPTTHGLGRSRPECLARHLTAGQALTRYFSSAGWAGLARRRRRGCSARRSRTVCLRRTCFRWSCCRTPKRTGRRPVPG